MRYTEIAIAKPFAGTPEINLPSVIGASPEKPVIIRIATTGVRPIKFTAENLPEGLVLENNIISGKVKNEGKYHFVIKAENALGMDEKEIVIEIKNDAVQLTPLMGFTSWNAFGFEVTQKDMEETAKIMLERGMCEYGYDHINIDSGWQGEYGGKFDAIQPNEKFPDMASFCDKMHKEGLKCGIYSTPMLNAFGVATDYVPQPLGCTQGEPDDRFADEHGGIGKIRKEKNNALQWAEWGFDYLKYDWRPCDPYNADLMKQELIKTDRDFGFCVSVKARPEYHTYWEKHTNSYRCNIDSLGTWDNLLEIYRTYFDFVDYINKGHYFDLDMLDIGDCYLFKKLGFCDEPGFGMTEDEQLCAYSMRAFLSSPIQISANLAKMTEFEFSLYCNNEIIAINQDCGFFTAKPYIMLENGKKIIHVFKKKLSGGEYAYMALNLGETEESVKIYLDDELSIRDAWAKKDMGINKNISVTMKPHTVRIFKTSKI